MKNRERDFMDWKTISEMLDWGLTNDSLTAKYNYTMNLFKQRLIKSCHFYIIQSAFKRKIQSCICSSQEEFRIENCFHAVSLQGINTFFTVRYFLSQWREKDSQNFWSSQEEQDNRIFFCPISDVRLIFWSVFRNTRDNNISCMRITNMIILTLAVLQVVRVICIQKSNL